MDLAKDDESLLDGGWGRQSGMVGAREMSTSHIPATPVEISGGEAVSDPKLGAPGVVWYVPFQPGRERRPARHL